MSFEPRILFAFGIILIHIAYCFNVVNCTDSDEIGNLPGQPPVNFKQFSGYIPVDDAQQRFLFYYFVEAQSDPSSKPLVLWFNGGPGCSSVGEGAFVEHGPFKPKGDVLIKNDYSWNKVANMLYLETPIGVGFSYSLDMSYYTSVNDALTARDNFVFLEKWFEKYPEYKNRDFYITGESYAGHYIPQLATLILESKSGINLKGIGIGNPLLEFHNDFNARGEYLWSHGLISDDTYDLFNKVCNYSTIRRQDNFEAISPKCADVAIQASKEISAFVNSYDITLDVCLSNVFSQSQVLDRNPNPEVKVDVCVEDETVKYLNQKDVQAALKARLVNVNEWTPCSSILQYEMADMEQPMTPVLASVLKSGIRVFIYSGDQDSVIPLTNTRLLVNGLAKQLGLATTLPYGAWFTHKQVAGWTQVYGDVLHFATIRGASHEAPYTQPGRSLTLFRAFLSGKPLPRIHEEDQNTGIVIPIF